MPWVAPCAVVFTIEQCRAWAAWGARLKAAITPTATAATSNLLMALSSLQVTVRGKAYTLRLTKFITSRRLGLWLRLATPACVDICVRSYPAELNQTRGEPQINYGGMCVQNVTNYRVWGPKVC